MLARHESEFEAAGEAELDLAEVARALRPRAESAGGARRFAIAHCLSGSEGWREAAVRCGGTFAGAKSETGLTGGKD